jgi:hypothetical protein
MFEYLQMLAIDTMSADWTGFLVIIIQPFVHTFCMEFVRAGKDPQVAGDIIQADHAYFIRYDRSIPVCVRKAIPTFPRP